MRAGVRHIKKTPFFGSAAGEVQESQKKSAIVLIFRTAQNLSAEGERHGTSHQLQQTHSQTTRCPSTWLHTHTTTTTTHKDFARNKKAPANVKRTHQHQWSSGRIHRCHRCDPGSDSRLMQFALSCICAHVLWEKKQNLDRRTLNSKP